MTLIPQKNVDKPHEESVLKFISMDRKLRDLIKTAGVDLGDNQGTDSQNYISMGRRA